MTPAAPPAVGRVLERVTATIRRHELLSPGDTVLVACSGGPDSIALLHALDRLRRLFRIRLAVFHFDHALRDRSGEDARYVQAQAERLGAPFLLRRATDRPRRGRSVEAWARLARYAALTVAAEEAGAHVAALGHTLDDQAETVLLGLVRGGGIEAVAGMPPRTSVPPLGFPAVRPLLDTTRPEVEAFCKALRLRPRRDPTNRDPRFLRNRIRRDVLPWLERTVDRDVRSTLARTAANVRGDAEYLEEVASEHAHAVVEVGEAELRLDADALAALPHPIAARVVRQAIRLAAAALGGSWETDAGAAHIESVLSLAAGRPGRRVDLPGDLMAERRKEYVRLSSPPARSTAGGSDGHQRPNRPQRRR
jgi:tRNA(Ile)-lysidine synthase